MGSCSGVIKIFVSGNAVTEQHMKGYNCYIRVHVAMTFIVVRIPSLHMYIHVVWYVHVLVC